MNKGIKGKTPGSGEQAPTQKKRTRPRRRGRKRRKNKPKINQDFSRKLPDTGRNQKEEPNHSPIITPSESRLSIPDLFAMVKEYGMRKSQQNHEISQLERRVLLAYEAYDPGERVRFFAQLYDDFSESYDRHFGKETGHFKAIKHVLFFASPFLRFPILDITAGTGEPLKYALEFMSSTSRLRTMINGAKERGDLDAVAGIESILPHLPEGRREDVENKDYWIYANEISDKMRALAEGKLGNYPKINFTHYNALSLYTTHLRAKFNTVLCSQTFHLMPHEDKIKLARSTYHALYPGGIAVVIEEDPFKISHTPPIEPVALIIRTIACPIENRGDLIGLFKNLGFIKLEPRAVWDIEGEVKHAMRLYIFMKPLSANGQG